MTQERAAIKTLIPEIKESEDEGMRKAALKGIEYLERDLGWDAIGDIDILDVKEYIEKQKPAKWDEYTKTNMEEYFVRIERYPGGAEVEFSGNTPCVLADQIKDLVKRFFKDEN